MLVGAAVGAGALALMQPERRSGAQRILRGATKELGRWGRRSAKAIDRYTPDVDARDLRRYAARARHAIDEAVHDELNDLRRAIRRRRKQLGV